MSIVSLPISIIVTFAAMHRFNYSFNIMTLLSLGCSVGVLVTNGQEEIASLANLITLRFAEANADYIREIGQLWRSALTESVEQFPQAISAVEGHGLLSSLVFQETDKAVAFSKIMSQKFCIDVSVQTYKANCPPAVLMKPPLITSQKAIDLIKRAIGQTLKEL